MRPCSSSTRTVLALQGLIAWGVVCSAWTKRGSRAVKYCVPWSKLPNGVPCVAMRPPTVAAFSNTVTRLPACTSVRAQAMPAMPEPTMAMWGALLILVFRCVVFSL